MLTAAFRHADAIGCLFGDGFAVLLVATDIYAAVERLNTALAAGSSRSDDSPTVAVTTGLAHRFPGSNDLAALLDQADYDMYQRKRRRAAAIVRTSEQLHLPPSERVVQGILSARPPADEPLESKPLELAPDTT